VSATLVWSIVAVATLGTVAAVAWHLRHARARADELIPTSRLREQGQTLRARVGDDLTEIFPLPAGIAVRKDVRVPLPDGGELSANVYLPQAAAGPVPVVMALTSYDKDLKPEDYTINGRGPLKRAIGTRFGNFRVSEETPFEGPDPAFWVPRGYAVVTVDAPGTGRSPGRKDVLGPATVTAFAHAIAWASTQDWSNGRVGTTGCSYLAIIQWFVAARNPPGLTAIIPWEGLTDPYRDSGLHGGIPETSFVRGWLAGGGVIPERLPLRFRAGPPLIARVPLPARAKAMLMYLQGAAPRPADMPFTVADVESIRVPALVAASWSMQGLHTRGAFNGFMALPHADKWLFTHGRHEWDVMNSELALEYQAAFFERFLKGAPTAMDGRPRVRLEVRRHDDVHDVRDEQEWPLARTVHTALHLNALSRTLTSEPDPAPALAQYNATRDDGLDFVHRFERDTEITGHASLRLWVSMDAGTDMDIFVALRKIDATGRTVEFDNHHKPVPIVSRGWLRVSERRLDPSRSFPGRPFLAHDAPLPVVPGERIPVDIEILPSSTLFEAGSSLVLTIRGRDITDERDLQHSILMNQGRHSVWTGGSYDSHLLLPVIPSAPRACTDPTATAR
jgi:predicted acyl esterase